MRKRPLSYQKVLYSKAMQLLMSHVLFICSSLHESWHHAMIHQVLSCAENI